MEGDELQLEALDEDSRSSWKDAKLDNPKIKRDPPGKVIFSADLYGCLYNEDTVVTSIESMVGATGVLDIPFLELFILRQPPSERNKLCQDLFILMSLTHDDELLFAMRKCTPLYDLGWRPSVRNLLTVFFNWGAPVPLLYYENFKPTRVPDRIYKDGNPRITAENIKLVLHHLESGLPHAVQESEVTVEVLVRTFFLLSMEKIFVTTFTRRFLLRCLSALVSQIPDKFWNHEKVWHLSGLAFTGNEDHIHDLAANCKKLFNLCERCEQVGLHFAYRIVCHCIQTVTHGDDEADIPELPVTVTHIVKLILGNAQRTSEMELFYFSIMVDLMYTAIVKNPVSKDDEQNVTKYLNYVLNAIRENYKSHDVTAVRQKIQRFSNLLIPKKSYF